MALIRFTFPQSYRPVTLQLPFGGDVSLLHPLQSSVVLGTQAWETICDANNDCHTRRFPPSLLLIHGWGTRRHHIQRPLGFRKTPFPRKKYSRSGFLDAM
jgi:hypothetical protein